MDLRPYAIEEGGGGYLEVVNHPRPPCRRQAERPVACSKHVWLCPRAGSERSTGTRPPLGVGAAVDPGRFIPLTRIGWDPAVSDPNPPLATSGHEKPMGSIDLKVSFGNDQYSVWPTHDAEREANRWGAALRSQHCS